MPHVKIRRIQPFYRLEELTEEKEGGFDFFLAFQPNTQHTHTQITEANKTEKQTTKPALTLQSNVTSRAATAG